MAAFFGCRPYLLFSTRVKFDSSVDDGLDKPTKLATATQRADVGKQNSSDVYMDDIYDTKSCDDDNVWLSNNQITKLATNLPQPVRVIVVATATAFSAQPIVPIVTVTAIATVTVAPSTIVGKMATLVTMMQG